jgi:hypothetical protein
MPVHVSLWGHVAQRAGDDAIVIFTYNGIVNPLVAGLN